MGERPRDAAGGRSGAKRPLEEVPPPREATSGTGRRGGDVRHAGAALAQESDGPPQPGDEVGADRRVPVMARATPWVGAQGARVVGVGAAGGDGVRALADEIVGGWALRRGPAARRAAKPPQRSVRRRHRSRAPSRSSPASDDGAGASNAATHAHLTWHGKRTPREAELHLRAPGASRRCRLERRLDRKGRARTANPPESRGRGSGPHGGRVRARGSGCLDDKRRSYGRRTSRVHIGRSRTPSGDRSNARRAEGPGRFARRRRAGFVPPSARRCAAPRGAVAPQTLPHGMGPPSNGGRIAAGRRVRSSLRPELDREFSEALGRHLRLEPPLRPSDVLIRKARQADTS